MRIAAIAVVLALCAACSPRLDWREIRPDGLGCTVLLPGRPAALTREIDLDGLRVAMTMHGARVDATSFTVAMARLPDGRDETRAKALSAMQRGMLRNISAASARPRAAEVPLVDGSGSKIGTVAAIRIDASGTANGRPVRMIAGFVARGARAWQWMAIGGPVDDEAAREFVDSFRLIEGGGS